MPRLVSQAQGWTVKQASSHDWTVGILSRISKKGLPSIIFHGAADENRALDFHRTLITYHSIILYLGKLRFTEVN